ncbi:hypothetical protein HLB23_23865 [Nocardia uniformis]|uniref:Uncharacterized protein n=1 Tax=Nocardia uniformis TaxID=53432 RepID=A0A849CA93_9NOCA|nr:hypothetical protein [Nocardia uniformis]NNH72857.1 hypothetical protein [Nocardia uniformis]
MSEEIFLDPERTQSLITSLNSSADTLAGIHASDMMAQTLLTLTTLIPGTAIHSAYLTGVTKADTAMDSTAERVRVLAVRTDNGRATMTTAEKLSADKFAQVIGGR